MQSLKVLVSHTSYKEQRKYVFVRCSYYKKQDKPQPQLLLVATVLIPFGLVH